MAATKERKFNNFADLSAIKELVVNQEENKDIIKNTVEKKAAGAISAINNKKSLDTSVENNFAQDLDNEADFKKEAGNIDKNRDELVKESKQQIDSILLNKKTKEDELSSIINELELAWEKENGSMYRQLTKKEIKKDKKIAELIGKDWDGQTTQLTKEASQFKATVLDQANKILVERFPEYDKKSEELLESEKSREENEVEKIKLDEKKETEEDVFKRTLEDAKAIIPEDGIMTSAFLQKNLSIGFNLAGMIVESLVEQGFIKEESFPSHLRKNKDLESEQESEIEIDVTEDENEESIFYESVLYMAQELGISEKDLLNNERFAQLNVEQQLFVLGTLSSNSFDEVRVRANRSFEEKSKSANVFKKISLAINKKYQQKKILILEAKNLKNEGISYYQKELDFLLDAIKDGPNFNEETGGVEFFDDRFSSVIDADLLKQCNFAASNLSAQHEGDKDGKYDKARVNFENNKKEILKVIGEKKPANAVDLINAMIKIEQDISFHQFISQDEDAMDNFNGLIGSSLGFSDRAKMLLGSQSDKLSYAAIGVAARTLLSKAGAYAVGPLSAALVGGIRANNMARKELKEAEDLSRLGVKDKRGIARKKAITVESRVDGKEENVNLGLTNRLNNLIKECDSLKAKVQLINMKDINSNSEDQKTLVKFRRVSDLLKRRIDYTVNCLDKKLVSFGSPSERTINYYNLNQALTEAKIRIYQNNVDSGDEATILKKIVGEEIPNLSKEKQDEMLLANSKCIARLNNFLAVKDKKQHTKEFIYLSKKTVVGTLIGASAAAAVSGIMDVTGAGDWLHDKLASGFNKVSDYFTSSDNADLNVSTNEQLVSTGKTIIKESGIHVQSSDQVAEASTSSLDNQVSDLKVVEVKTDTETLVKTSSINTGESSNPSLASEAETLNSDNSNVTNSEVTVDDALVKTDLNVKAVEATSSVSGEKTVFSDTISNEGLQGKSDSAWRSIKEIFIKNPQEFGYKGDINNSQALNSWAEQQTNTTIASNGGVEDIVHEGNHITITKEANGFNKLSIDSGDGLKPSYSSTVDDSASADHILNSSNQSHDIADNPLLTKGAELEIASNIDSSLVSAKITPLDRAVIDFGIHGKGLKVDDATGVITYEDNGAIFNINPELNEIIVKTPDNYQIPAEFVNSLKTSPDETIQSFVSENDGLNKIMSSWNSLSLDDKGLYDCVSHMKDDAGFKNLLKYLKNDLGIKEKFLKKLAYNTNTSQIIFKRKGLFYKDKFFDVSFSGLKEFIGKAK